MSTVIDVASEDNPAGVPLSERGPAPVRVVAAFGFWLFLLSDIIVFSALFAAYAVLSGETNGGPSPAVTGREPGTLPLHGVRVLDFSWVIAGPTTTRYLAAMGAEVIKVEAPGRGDHGRATELHTVLGQAKRGIALDLKKSEAVAVARALAAKSDVLVENFATGVMDRDRKSVV